MKKIIDNYGHYVSISQTEEVNKYSQELGELKTKLELLEPINYYLAQKQTMELTKSLITENKRLTKVTAFLAISTFALVIATIVLRLI